MTNTALVGRTLCWVNAELGGRQGEDEPAVTALLLESSCENIHKSPGTQPRMEEVRATRALEPSRHDKEPEVKQAGAESLLAARSYLQACLLLLLGESPGHGYDLGEALSALGLRINDSGRVYRALRLMEQEGLVVSWWEEAVSGPARRMYRLTDHGGQRLEAFAALVCDSWRHLSGYLDRWRRLPPPIPDRRVAAV